MSDRYSINNKFVFTSYHLSNYFLLVSGPYDRIFEKAPQPATPHPCFSGQITWKYNRLVSEGFHVKGFEGFWVRKGIGGTLDLAW